MTNPTATSTETPTPRVPGQTVSFIAPLPLWSQNMIALYESHAVNQFVLHGNVNDRIFLPLGAQAGLGSVRDFLLKVLFPRFEVVLSYDIGNGIRIEKGGEIFSQWPPARSEVGTAFPREPRAAIEFLTHYFRYCANLARLGQPSHRIACFITSTDLVAPAMPSGFNYDLNALALLLRSWATDDLLTRHQLVTALIADNLNDLTPLLTRHPRVAAIQIGQPTLAELQATLSYHERSFPIALAAFAGKLPELAEQLVGSSVSSVEELLKMKEYNRITIQPSDLVGLKKSIIERDCQDLIEFIETTKTLDDVHSQDQLKGWLREDMNLWRQSQLQALPMGYLICGPVGTGKTFMVECLAGEAGVPVVKIKNFRDKWVGTTEGNLERIFRLLHALGRCFVFIDEADQALGKRDSGGGDSGVSGRIYSMIAKEMSNGDNRGKIIWVLASSRPDLIEIDLKRPGRIDLKIPLFPTSTATEGYKLIAALCKRRGIAIPPETEAKVASLIPNWLTPGAAEALAVKTLRVSITQKISAVEALERNLHDYQPPIALPIMENQIRLTVNEASDWEFVPPAFRHFRTD